MNDIQRHQIFIVDDSKIQLILLEKLLTKEGFDVHSFTNGYNLLQTLEKVRPSLIISDIEMPLLSGFDLIDEVKNGMGEMEIPFFLISSYSDLSVQEKARKKGVEVFLQKPFKYQVLVDVIREMITTTDVKEK